MSFLVFGALAVGLVISGEYFGWNQGLKEGGPAYAVIKASDVMVGK